MKLIGVFLFLFSSWAVASDHSHDHMDHSDMMHHSHEGHLHNELVDGEKLEVNPDRFDKFVSNLSNAQVAVISVKGMVCDFCARGIEKTFQKDKLVKKIDVDLAKFGALGNDIYNPYIMQGDVVFIPFKEKSISIYGGINIPGNYEFVENENLLELIDLALSLIHI